MISKFLISTFVSCSLAAAQTTIYGLTMTRTQTSDPTGSSCGNALEFAVYGAKWLACTGGSWQVIGGVSGGSSPAGSNGQIQYNNSGAFGGSSIGGDGTLSVPSGTLTISKTNGVPFAVSATLDATNAGNISSGTLSAARLPGSIAANTTGNAATATALAATPTPCAAGYHPRGVDARGNVVNCIADAVGSQGPAGLSGGYQVIEWALGQSGPVAVGDTTHSSPPATTTTLAGCFAHADTAPAGAALVIDIQSGGVSVFGANPKIAIADGANDSSFVSIFTAPAISPTSTLKAVVTQIGSSAAGAGILVACRTTDTGISVSVDGTMTSPSNNVVPSQLAISTFVAAYVSTHGGSGSMVYPVGTGVPLVSGGTSWGTTLVVGTAANNLVQLNSGGYLPALNGSLLTNLPILNQNTTGTAATATNIIGGATGSIPYQNAASATVFLAPNTGNTDQVVISHGTGVTSQVPVLSNAPALSAANMTGFPTLNQNTAGTAATATALAIPRAINGVNFDGTAGITIADATKVSTATTVNGHTLNGNVTVSASDLTTGTLPHAQLSALISGDIPANAANTTGTAAGLTAAYIDWNAGSGGPSILNKPTLPAGAVVGTTDTQTLTNKTVDGISPVTLGYLDATSSIQTQLDGKRVELLWAFCGGAACNNDTAPSPRPLGVARSLLSCSVMAGTAPSGGPVVFDLQLDGTSVYGANSKPTIASGADCKNNAAGCTATTFATTALPAGAHYLTASITGTSGQNVVGLCVAR